MASTLEEYILAWPGFDWSEANCAHFAAGWAAPQALQGVTMPACARGVRQTLRAMGARSLRQAVSARLGAEIQPAMARRGDVVLSGRTLGLCVGRLAALPLRDGAGVGFVPMDRVDAAWRRP
jgi:hypothetical protein